MTSNKSTPVPSPTNKKINLRKLTINFLMFFYLDARSLSMIRTIGKKKKMNVTEENTMLLSCKLSTVTLG